MKIFLIDKDPNSAQRYNSLAGDGTVEVTQVDSMQDASWESGNCFDCVVVDLESAGIEENGLLQRLPEISSNLPIIVTSKFNNIGLAVKLMQAGVCDIVEKPFTSHRMNQALQKATPSL